MSWRVCASRRTSATTDRASWCFVAFRSASARCKFVHNWPALCVISSAGGPRWFASLLVMLHRDKSGSDEMSATARPATWASEDARRSTVTRNALPPECRQAAVRSTWVGVDVAVRRAIQSAFFCAPHWLTYSAAAVSTRAQVSSASLRRVRRIASATRCASDGLHSCGRGSSGPGHGGASPVVTSPNAATPRASAATPSVRVRGLRARPRSTSSSSCSRVAMFGHRPSRLGHSPRVTARRRRAGTAPRFGGTRI